MASIRGIDTVVHIHAIVMAPALNLISWNVRGMGDASKRYAIFASLKHFFPAIVFLSETHFLKEKLHLLQKPWVGHAFHSVYSSHARGVSILIHRQIPFRCGRSLIDPDGRFICLDCFIHNVPIILVAVYVPPPYSGDVLKRVLAFLDASSTAPSLIVGDFNNYLHPHWDKFHLGTVDPNSRPTSLSRILDEIGFRDVWRM